MRRFARGASASALLLLLATCRVDRITQSPPLPILAVTPLRLRDSAAVGSLAVRGGGIEVANLGDGSLAWHARAALRAPWLVLSPERGTAPATVRISLAAGALAPGVYRDTIIVSAENTEGSPVHLPVEFVIHPCAVQAIAAEVTFVDSITLSDCAVPHGAGRLGRLYSFNASAGDSISVVMTSPAFTGRVSLDSSADATTDLLAEGEYLRYQLLPRSGAFVLEATTASPAQVGTFTLDVSRPRAPAAADRLRQLGADSSTVVVIGGTVDYAGVVLRGSLHDPDDDSLHLEVELRPAADPLTGTATVASARVPNGAHAVVSVQGLASGASYQWQARVVDQTGRTTPWLPFGDNEPSAPDFSVGDVAREMGGQSPLEQSAAVSAAVATPPAVVVRDQFHNPVAGVHVTFLVTAGGGVVEPTAVTTDASGIAATTRWTVGTVAGANSVTATAGGAQINGNPAMFSAIGIAGTATALTLATPPSDVARSGIAFPQQPVVQLVDAYGNPAPQAGTEIAASLVTGGPELSGGRSIFTTVAGVAAFSDLTITGASGARTLSFTAATLPPISSVVNVTSGIATQIAVHGGNSQVGVVGAVVATPPSVIVSDASGNPVPGAAVIFTVVPGHGSITGEVQTTDAGGIATLGSWTLGTTAQPCTLIVTAAGLLGSPVTFVDTAKAGPPATFTVVSGDSLTSEVGSVLSSPHRVRITDAHGNPVAGISVAWSADVGGGSVDPRSALTDDAGYASTARTLGPAPGTQTTSATATLVGAPTVLLFHIIAGVGPPVQLLATGGQSQTGPVGTNLSAPLSVRVIDRFGNGVPAVGITWTVPPGGGAVFPVTSVTDPAGHASTSWTLGASATVQVVHAEAAGAPSSLLFSATATPGPVSPSRSSVTATPTVITASTGDSAATITVTARDAHGNLIPGAGIALAVSGSANTLTQPFDTTNASGEGAGLLSSTKAEPKTISVVVDGTAITEQATVTVAPADAAALALVVHPSHTTAGAAITPALQVNVRDRFDNLVSTAATQITLHFGSNAGNGTLGGTVTQTAINGVVTFLDISIDKAASGYTLEARSPPLSSATSNPFDVTAASPNRIARHGVDSQTATVNTAVATPPTVIVQDQFDNPVSGVAVMFAVQSGGGMANPTTAVATNAQGIAAVESWTLGTTAGLNTLTATATATGLPSGLVTFAATGTADAPARIATSAGNDQVATVNTVVATPPAVLVRDQFDNPVSGVVVTFALDSGGGAITDTAQTTNADGTAAVGTWTLGTVAGPYTLTAFASGLTGSPVVFAAAATAGAPSGDRSLLDASPATLTASNGSSTATVTVTVRDSFSNLVSGVTVTLAATGAANVLTQPTDPTDASGQVTGTFSSTRAEPKTITATLNDTVPLADTAMTSVIHAAAAVITGNAGSDQMGHVEDPVATPPAVLVTDEFGNPVPGAAVTFAVASGGGSVSPTGDVTTGSDGIAAATSWTLGLALGPHTLLASSAGLGGSPVLFTAVGILPPVPDPTVLAPASGQAPDVAAYAALDVPSQAAGFSYTDPVTGIRIWKVTSSTLPQSSIGGGHDYADGGNQVSRGWGPGNNTHTLLILSFQEPGAFTYYLVDFTRGIGFSNYRRLTVQPRGDLAATFSSLRSQPRILYILTATQLVRYNTETMQAENTGNFPLTIAAHSWLHQDKSDVWFVGRMENETAFAWNSQTNELLTQSEPWLNEPRLDRDGRYAVLSGTVTVRLWDLTTNTLGPTQVMDPGTVGPSAAFWFGHIASLRGRWVTANPNATAPATTDRYFVSGGEVAKVAVLANSFGYLMHQAGNWIQYDAELGGDLDRQWAYGAGYGVDDARFAWRHAVGLVRADGSESRLLLHHYSSDNPEYYASPWGMPSPDGKVVIFNSDMLGSGRWDLFIAEIPIRFP